MKNIVLVTLAVALVPCLARAQSGVVLINQATVLASAPYQRTGSTGGFPYTITQPGSYQLTSNLTVPGNNAGIVIAASFVSLDLNGFTIENISCPLSCSVSAITDNGMQQYGIKIRNGNIFGFGNGIDLTETTGSVIEKVTVQSTGGIGIHVFNSGIIKDCIALFNSVGGIVADVHGTISGSVASGNGGVGIAIATGTLTGNTADGNTGGGISVLFGNSTLTGNTASNNSSGFGFSVGGGSTVTGNTASANGTGFQVVCPSNLIGNTAEGGTPETETGSGCNKVNNLGF